MRHKQKGTFLGLFAGLAFGIMSMAAFIAPSLHESANEVDQAKSPLELQRDMSELSDAFGQATAAGIVRNNCAEDLLWFLRVGETNWTDAWCAQHYNHLTTNRTFGE